MPRRRRSTRSSTGREVRRHLLWVALRLRRDANHDAAVRLWVPGSAIPTTNHVVGETWTFLRRRDGHAPAVAFLDAVESAGWLTVVHVDEGVEREARAWLRRHDERAYSFVDATSFVTMRRERLVEALAFDGDFSAAGFIEARRCPDRGRVPYGPSRLRAPRPPSAVRVPRCRWSRLTSERRDRGASEASV